MTSTIMNAVKTLIPIGYIPLRARSIEILKRRDGVGATYRIEVAPCDYPGPPPVVGWVCSHAAAEAYVQLRTYRPGNYRLVFSRDD